MSISSAFTYENFPEAHRRGLSCFSPSRVVCSSQLKRMIEVLNVGMLKNTLFLALTVANVIFFVLKFMASLTSSPPQIIKTKSEFVCHPQSVGCCFV